jgi:histone-lysine N-methyltransferase SETD3
MDKKAKENGDAYFLQSQFDQAIESYSKCLELQPKCQAALSNRSAAYAAVKKYKLAIVDADAVIRAFPKWEKGYYRKGYVEEAMGQWRKAHCTYTAALKACPDSKLMTEALQRVTLISAELSLPTIYTASSGVTLDSKKTSSEGRGIIKNGKSPPRAQTDSDNSNPNSGAETAGNSANHNVSSEKTQSEDALAVSVSDAGNFDTFDEMVNWIERGKGALPFLYMQKYSTEHRGVHALRDIPPNEIILFVPLTHIMTTDKAKASDIGKKIQKSGLGLLTSHSWLAMWILEERALGKASFWFPYLRNLPVAYNNIPTSWSAEEQKWLKGSFCLEKMAQRMEELKREYSNICSHVPEFKTHGFNQFVWARQVVITRIFAIEVGDHKTDGLVPYADMLNHNPECKTAWTFDNEKYGFIITATGPLRRGDEVFDSYGRKCNHRFLVNYGFTLDNNQSDNEAVLRFQMDPADRFYQLKLQQLGSESIETCFRHQVPASSSHASSRAMFRHLRFMCASGSDLQRLDPRADRLDRPLSVECERRVLQMVKDSAETALAAFETSLEEDEALLASGELAMFSNHRNAVMGGTTSYFKEPKQPSIKSINHNNLHRS